MSAVQSAWITKKHSTSATAPHGRGATPFHQCWWIPPIFGAGAACEAGVVYCDTAISYSLYAPVLYENVEKILLYLANTRIISHIFMKNVNPHAVTPTNIEYITRLSTTKLPKRLA